MHQLCNKALGTGSMLIYYPLLFIGRLASTIAGGIRKILGGISLHLIVQVT